MLVHHGMVLRHKQGLPVCTYENRSGSGYAPLRRVAFGFVYVATGYVCWLLVKYYQARTSLEYYRVPPRATHVWHLCLCTALADAISPSYTFALCAFDRLR